MNVDYRSLRFNTIEIPLNLFSFTKLLISSLVLDALESVSNINNVFSAYLPINAIDDSSIEEGQFIITVSNPDLRNVISVCNLFSLSRSDGFDGKFPAGITNKFSSDSLLWI